MTNTNELTAKLKAAAEDEIMCREACDTSDLWQDVASPENVLALTEALEAAESRIAEFKARVKAAEKRYENRTPTEWAYDQACAAIEKHRARADAAEARIAELEARTLTVNLIEPTRYDCEGYHIDEAYLTPAPDGECYDREEALTAFKSACAAAGIKLQIEGE